MARPIPLEPPVIRAFFPWSRMVPPPLLSPACYLTTSRAASAAYVHGGGRRRHSEQPPRRAAGRAERLDHLVAEIEERLQTVNLVLAFDGRRRHHRRRARRQRPGLLGQALGLQR